MADSNPQMNDPLAHGPKAPDELMQPDLNIDRASRTPADRTGAYLSSATPTETAGTIIAGKYKLLQQVGEGGMGAVWMADQLEPVKRRVAVKLIRSESEGSKTILSRFEAERQAIALMDHPNIAKLLDAGTTDGEPGGGPGRPYFVMELVKGIPLTDYCDQHKLSVPERLELFTRICSAVQHAHQKGIIHRDLKPSNILVESHDDRPVPKVIDFGLAKALSGQPLTDHTLFTGFGTVAGTPLYMAPEQAKFNAIDIDTRADVYALGVILYELLTGSTPIDRVTFKQAALDEMLRLVREQEPPTPSKRLSSTESKPAVAANRQTEPMKLGRIVKGELDWIVMKALSKERDRRYETANGFARDIERFLNHEPVLAGPPSASYRLQKFVQRNRPQVIAASLVLAALMVGIVGTTVGLIRAERARWEEAKQRGLAQQNEKRAIAAVDEERKAKEREAGQRARADANYRRARQAIDEFYVRYSKGLADQPGAQPLRKELLASSLKLYEGFLDDYGADPGLRAEIAMTHWRVARIRQDLGETGRAIANYQEAMKLQDQLVTENPQMLSYRESLAATCNNLSLMMARVEQWPEAFRLAKRALHLREQSVRESPDDLASQGDCASSYSNIAVLYNQAGKRQEALRLEKKALEMRTQRVNREPNNPIFMLDLAQSNNNLGAWYHDAGDRPSALRHYEQALGLWEKLRERSPRSLEVADELVRVHYNLSLLHQRVDIARAIRHGESARDIGEELVRGNPAVPSYRRCLADAERTLGIALHSAGRHKDALACFQNSYDRRVKLAGEYPSDQKYQRELGQGASNLGAMLQKMGRFTDAIRPATTAVEVYESILKSASDENGIRANHTRALMNLGAIQSDAGKPAAALEILDKAIAGYHQLMKGRLQDPAMSAELAGAFENRAVALSKLERWEGALSAWTEAASIHKTLQAKSPNNDAYRNLLSEDYFEMAKLHRRLGQVRQAAEQALERQALWPTNGAQLYNVACELALCVPLVGKGSQASEAELAERKRYADAAMQALRQAIANGYKDAAHIAKDPDLEPLRGREDFKMLMADLEKKRTTGMR